MIPPSGTTSPIPGRSRSPKIIGTDNFTGSELIDAGGAAVEGVLYVVPQPIEETERASIFREAYRARYGSSPPSLFNVMGYDVIRILYEVYQESEGRIDEARSILRSSEYEGASGMIKFDSNGDLIGTQYRHLVLEREGITGLIVARDVVR